jgi:hypothetical protein
MTKKIKKLRPKGTPHFTLEAEPIDYNSLAPIFSFRHMKYRSHNCLSQCSQDSKSDVINTLLKLSQLSWNQISSSPSTGLGFENIPLYRFTAPLPSIVTEEVPSLKVFRYSGSGRIAGIREKDIYHILLVGTDLYTH